MKFKHFVVILIFLVSCSDKIIRNQTDKNHCLVFGQINYIYPGMIEEGLRELVLINLQTNDEYKAQVFIYEKGFLIVDIPIGQYAIKNVRWLFLDTKSLAKSGLYRQISIELKFTSESYDKTNFEIKAGGIYYAGVFSVNHETPDIIKTEISSRFFAFLDKILERLEFSSWKDMFKKNISNMFDKYKTYAYRFLKSKYPKLIKSDFNTLRIKYLTD